MSIMFDGNVIFKHEALGTEHKITIYDSTGKALCESISGNMENAKALLDEMLMKKIKQIASGGAILRKLVKCCDKKGDGKYKMSKKLIQYITETDYLNGHLGLITQSEMSRISGISRQAVNQKINNESLEFFEWMGSRMIPFDTVSLLETKLEPMVMYHKDSAKKPRRKRT